jgi:hypothetical protein
MHSSVYLLSTRHIDGCAPANKYPIQKPKKLQQWSFYKIFAIFVNRNTLSTIYHHMECLYPASVTCYKNWYTKIDTDIPWLIEVTGMRDHIFAPIRCRAMACLDLEWPLLRSITTQKGMIVAWTSVPLSTQLSQVRYFLQQDIRFHQQILSYILYEDMSYGDMIYRNIGYMKDLSAHCHLSCDIHRTILDLIYPAYLSLSSSRIIYPPWAIQHDHTANIDIN